MVKERKTTKREATAVKQREGNTKPQNPKTQPIYKPKTLTPTSQPSNPISNPKPNSSSGPEHTNFKSLLSHNTNSQWIFDCGATDTMTFDPSDFLSTHPTNRTHIQTANGEYVPVAQPGPVNISPSLHLKNCLLIPSLSHKLLSVS